MLKLAWKYMKGYKKHGMVCITGIAFSVMLIFSLIGISNRIMAQYQNMLWSMVSTFDVKIKDIDTNQMEKIYNDIFQDDCKKIMRQNCGVIYTENGMPVHLLAVEGDWQDAYRTELVQGCFPEKEYEVCVEERFAKEYRIEISDVVEYELYDDAGELYQVTFEVTGIVKNLPNATWDKYIFTNRSTVIALEKNNNFVVEISNNSLLIEFDKYTYNLEKVSDLAFILTETYGTSFYRDNLVYNEAKEELILEKDTFFSYSSAFYGICAVVFVCMTMFVYNAISINMTEKIRQYGMLRCIGITNKNMIFMILIEQLFYAVIGTVVGIIGGRLLNTVVADKLMEPFGVVLDSGLKESIGAYLITVVVVLVAVFLAFGAMLLKMRKKKPIEMLCHMEDMKEVKQTGKRKSVLFDMASRNINRNKSKSRILMSTIFVATLLIVLIGNAITSIQVDMNKTMSAIAQVEVDSWGGALEHPFIEKETIELIKNHEAVQELYWQKREASYDLRIEGQVSDEIGAILVYSDNLMEKFMQFNDVKGLDIREDIAIVLSDKDMDSISEIKLQTDMDVYGSPDAKKEYTVAVDAYVPMSQSALLGQTMGYHPCLIVNEALGKKILGEIENYTNIYIDMTDDMDIFSIKEMIGIDEYMYFDMSSYQVDAQNQLISMVIMALYMLVSVIVLNLFVISNTVKSNISLREKEIGMLRSIGAEKVWIEKMISNEIMLLTLKGLVAGVVVAIPVSIHVYIAINEAVGIGYGGFLVGIPIVLCGVYFISRVIMKSCLKPEITEMIRNE